MTAYINPDGPGFIDIRFNPLINNQGNLIDPNGVLLDNNNNMIDAYGNVIMTPQKSGYDRRNPALMHPKVIEYLKSQQNQGYNGNQQNYNGNQNVYNGNQQHNNGGFTAKYNQPSASPYNGATVDTTLNSGGGSRYDNNSELDGIGVPNNNNNINPYGTGFHDEQVETKEPEVDETIVTLPLDEKDTYKPMCLPWYDIIQETINNYHRYKIQKQEEIKMNHKKHLGYYENSLKDEEFKDLKITVNDDENTILDSIDGIVNYSRSRVLNDLEGNDAIVATYTHTKPYLIDNKQGYKNPLEDALSVAMGVKGNLSTGKLYDSLCELVSHENSVTSESVFEIDDLITTRVNDIFAGVMLSDISIDSFIEDYRTLLDMATNDTAETMRIVKGALNELDLFVANISKAFIEVKPEILTMRDIHGSAATYIVMPIATSVVCINEDNLLMELTNALKSEGEYFMVLEDNVPFLYELVTRLDELIGFSSPVAIVDRRGNLYDIYKANGKRMFTIKKRLK